MSNSKEENVLTKQQEQSLPLVSIQSLNKSYNNSVTALENISLDIYEQEFFALLGPSGCGKSTLLRILAGFETPTSGNVLLDGHNIVDIPAYKRPINMMFQSYALFPHMTVEKNIAFGLHQDKLSKQEIAQRTSEALEMVKLNDLAKRKPHQLSGGQQQRTALARSLIKRPKLLLLDEPLGALDKKLREETQFELVDLQEKLKMTFIVVTHDQEEAMTMASRIAVMNQGNIAQLGPPIEIYESPRSHFVAEFIGNINVFEGNIDSIDNEQVRVNCLENCFSANYVPRYEMLKSGDKVGYAVRPEKIKIKKLHPNQNKKQLSNHLIGKVIDIGYLGSHSIYHVELPSKQNIVASSSNKIRHEHLNIVWEDEVILSWDSAAGILVT